MHLVECLVCWIEAGKVTREKGGDAEQGTRYWKGEGVRKLAETIPAKGPQFPKGKCASPRARGRLKQDSE